MSKRKRAVRMIWLRQQGYNVKANTTTASSYVPKRVYFKDSEFCSCGFNKPVSDNVCRFCNHKLRRMIKESILKNVR